MNNSYPRPQVVRDAWQCLNGEWDFAFDDQRRYSLPDDDIEWTHRITVPFAPEAERIGLGDTVFHTVCLYLRTFEL